jgi:uncharacterized protein YacL
MLISALVFIGFLASLRVTSAVLHVSSREIARSSLISISIGLVLSSLVSSLAQFLSASLSFEDLPYLTPVILTGNVIFGTYAYAILFEDSYLKTLKHNVCVFLIASITTAVAYVILSSILQILF